MINEKFSHSIWRVVKTPPAPGAWNMAVDEAILTAIGRQEVPPTLRLYSWQPACLSLGYAQPFSDVDQARVSQHGWEVVRRVTGGRAILHTDELTYSVSAPYSEPRLAGSVIESYRRLSQALLTALNALALPAQALPNQLNETDKKKQDPVCFEVPSNYEITVAGKKLIGSAQARKKAGILQHGTLPLVGDLTRITQALIFENERERQQAADRLLNRATTVKTAINQNVSWEAAAEAFIQAFAETLNLTFEPAPLTPTEITLADQLVAEKYTHPSWNERI